MATQNINDTIEVLEKQKAELLENVKSIDITIAILKSGNGINNEKVEDGYNKEASLKEKAFYLIKKGNRFLHNREISKLANEKEPGIEVSTFVKKFSPVLSALKNDGILTNIIIDGANQNVFWGSPKWLDEDGKIKKGYEYDKNQLAGKKTNEFSF